MLRRRFSGIVVAALFGMVVGGATRIATAGEANEQAGGAGQVVKAEAPNGDESCPVTGEKIDRKDLAKAYKYEYKGKTYYFCCAACVSSFKENPEKYIGKAKE